MADNIGFMMSDVSRLMRRRFDERARKSGATGPQWRTLKILERHEGLNQGQIAELLEVEPITCCRMIDRLEEAGLVERRRDPADRRAWLIYLTAKAGPIITQLRSLADSMIEHALDGLDDKEREKMFAALRRIRTNLNDNPEDKEAKHG
jgi:DNA-binding MarR family transcriptional regulator